MKKMMMAVMVVCAAAAFADEMAKTNSVAARVKSKRERSMELFNKRTGGKIVFPGSLKGQVVIVNAQTAAKEEWMKELAAANHKQKAIDIAVRPGKFSFPDVKIEGNASLYVIDDPAMPSILHAPEQRWTMVNVASLKIGNGAKPAFFEARVRKELTRGFALLCGTQTSNYPNSLLGCVTKPEDLDTFASADLPVDIPERYLPYLAGFGVTPQVMVPYITACREGWAPPPTNDNQKAVWEKIHALPTNPMKIEFDPKKGR